MEMAADGSVELLIFQEPPSVTVQTPASTVMSELCKQVRGGHHCVCLFPLSIT